MNIFIFLPFISLSLMQHCIINSPMRDTIKKIKEDDFMKANKFVISNNINTDAIPSIKESITSHDGINAVRFDMQAKTVTVDYDEEKYSEKQIASLINQAGLTVNKIQ